MALFELEHSEGAYRADFALYGAAIALLAAYLLRTVPHGQWLATVALAAIGLVGWSAIEYGIHRFVLHGLPPFKGWHAQHHRRPSALIAMPTLLSAALIGALVFLPAWGFANGPDACALTLGVLIGYFGYSLAHHATHHWPADSACSASAS